MKRLLYETFRTSRSSRHSVYVIRLQWQHNPTCTQYPSCHVWHRDWAYAHSNSPPAYGSVVISETSGHMIDVVKVLRGNSLLPEYTPINISLINYKKTNPSWMKNIFPPININNSSTIHDKSNIFVPIVSQGKISCPPRHSINVNQTKLPTQVDQAHTSIKSSYHYRVNSSSALNLTITQLNRLNPPKYRNWFRDSAWYILLKSFNIKIIMEIFHDSSWISQID